MLADSDNEDTCQWACQIEEDFIEQRTEPPSLVQTDVGENFPAQQVDWQNVNVKPMGGDGFDKPMAEQKMCDILGIPSNPSDDGRQNNVTLVSVFPYD
jgi:hypothetical protein